ncbi:ABC transporter [Mycobacterium sp. MS1601]|uniref:ABC transporter permease n=1 Tax=Mycobacterium sp. MS1601 TaxID=1936029 RepID=UPI00097922EA|nr:ABC transporter permease [Mycobacterium sp. MS1601]AQA05611.1 ABC transporter [Mycobacterium sp. MS1601]
MNSLITLTERVLRGTLRDFDLLIAVLAPVSTYVGFTFILQNVIDTGSMSYSQYVLPVIVVQSILFGTMTAAERASKDENLGFARRLRTLPIHTLVPLGARMVYCMIRSVVVIIASVATAYLFGFRFTGGFWFVAAFVGITLALALALSLGADALGASAKRMDAASQLLLIPMLTLALLSTGMAPAESFPGWVQPFVRAQPVSVITESMRGFADGSVSGGNLAASIAWCAGLLVLFGGLAFRLQRRTE